MTDQPKPKKGKPIYTQGEKHSQEDLSEVSKKRLAALYDIWLKYLQEELSKIDREEGEDLPPSPPGAHG